MGKLTALAALLGSSVGAYAALQSLKDLPPWAVRMIEQQAVGMLGFVILLGCIVYFAPQLIHALNSQAAATAQASSALHAVAEKGSRMEEKLDEVLINQRIFITRLEGPREFIHGRDR